MKKTLQSVKTNNIADANYSSKSLFLINFKKLFIIAICILFASGNIHAQLIKEGIEEPEWQSASLNPNNSSTTSGSIVISATSANSVMSYYICTNASTGTVSATATTTGTKTASSKSTITYISTDNNTCPNSGTWWYLRGVAVTDNRLSKAHSATHSWDIGGGGYLITPVVNGGVVTVSFWSSSSGTGDLFVGLNTATGNPPPQSYSTKSTYNGFTSGVQSIAINGTMQSYVYTTVMTAPAQVGFFSTFSSTSYIDDINITVNPGTQASVTTNSAFPTYSTAVVTGAITANNPSPNAYIVNSGVCYALSSVTNTPDTSNKHTVDGPSGVISGSISDTIKGLTPGTAYCLRVYSLTTAGVIYGNVICFTTKAAIAPVISTNPINILSSVAATSGGNITDSGGLVISASGVCWNTTGNPTIADNITKDGNSGSFLSSITGLLPCVKYYVRAYATNSKGTTYGNELTFTTPCVPSLLATPGVLNFGNVPLGTSSTLTYTLTGALLSPASGTISIIAPSGYTVSVAGIPASDTLNITYSGGVLPSTVVTVTFSPSVYGINTGIIKHSGGGAIAPNIQYITVNGGGAQPANSYSNTGIDFWTGFGYLEDFVNNTAKMSVYISAPYQDADVTVDMPRIFGGFSSTVHVPAHTVVEVNAFPTSGATDSRLWYTGKSNRGVHVVSTTGVPVSVWTYTNEGSDNSATGCLNFPTNTWNSSYTVQSMAGASNNANPFPYFFVIAKQDSTVIEITPTADIIDSSQAGLNNTYVPLETVKYPKGVPFTITLNKGEVFNALAYIGTASSNNSQYDLSGTKIKTNSCDKKIAVFGGNGRCLIETVSGGTGDGGSDNMMQQMFPMSAWGNEYLSVPTKTMENNVYRIFVQDTATIVRVNNDTLDKSTLINNAYYQVSDYLPSGDYLYKPNEFYSSKPICVTQFITSNNTHNVSVGNNGLGDPEMIILSPINQAINNVTVYSPTLKNNRAVYGNYINVIIPKSGVSSFRMYSDTNKVNAGDSINYIDPGTSLPYHLNQLTYSNTNVGGGTFNFIYRKFADTSLLMVDTGSSSFTGAAYASADLLIPIDSAFQPHPADPNYYYAKFRVAANAQYTLTSNIEFNAIAYGMDDGESYGFNAGTNLNVINVTPGHPHIISTTDTSKYHIQQEDLNTIKTCLSIPFHYSIALSFKPDSLTWNFDISGAPNTHIFPNKLQRQIAPAYDSTHKFIGDTTLYYFYTLNDAAGNPIKYTFDKVGPYPVTVTAYTKTTSVVFLDPCTVDTTNGVAKNTYNFTIDVTTGVHPGFTPVYATCSTDTTYKFFDNTWDENSNDTSFIIGRIWNFGNGKTDTANKTTVTSSFLSSGVYPVRLIAIDKIGCVYDVTNNQSIKLKPIANFAVVTDTLCAGSSATFIDHSTIIGKGILDKISTWYWDYGNGTNTFTDSARKSNPYKVAGTYPVSLKVTNGIGCDSSYTLKNIYVSANPVPDFVFSSDVCLNAISQFTNQSTIAYGHSLNYIWDFGDTTRLDSSIITKDSATAIHTYKGNGAYNVTLTAYNTYKNNLTCTSSKTKSLDVLYTLIPLQVDSIYHEGFEPTVFNHNPVFFPPVSANGQRWHIYPPNSSGYTSSWTRDSILNIVPSEANSSAWAHNYGTTVKQTDALNTPVFGLPVYSSKNDSLFLKFDVAAKTNFSSGGSNRDTLEVQMSSKCNNNWVTIYKKWGADLQTFHDASVNTPGEFKVNNKSQWRTDSINITALHDTLGNKFSTMIQNGDSVRFKFVDHNNNENNIYLDNINIYVNVDKGQGFYTTTIPFDTALIIHDYDFRNLKSITIYDMTGRLIHTVNYNTSLANSVTSSRFTFRPGYNGIPYMANGMYVVVMTYSDQQRRVFNFLKQ